MKVETNFESLGLSEESLLAVKKKGFTKPSEIQAKIIPLVFENKFDIIGVSHTGSGKTASFALPLLDLIVQNNKSPKAIILAPTRELALQVTEEIISYRSKKSLKIFTVYGGTSINNQISDLKKGCDILVGTPGRILDLIDRKMLDLSQIEYFILDEADEMLRMGFIDDIELIFQCTPKNKRVLLFSATMPDKIIQLSKKYMKNQKIIEIEKKLENKADIEEKYIILRREEKFQTLCNIIDMEDFFYGIIFCKTRADVDELCSNLKKAAYDVDGIHGEIMQSKRERILQKFRDLKLNILVATDVAARGIDVNNLSHVINYTMPNDVESYIHRIGRTGRAGKKGVSISFVSNKDRFFLKEIENVSKRKILELKPIASKDIIAKNKNKFANEIEEIIIKKDISPYLDSAEDLLSKHGDLKSIAGLLFKLNETNKKEIKEYSPRENYSDRDSKSSRKDYGDRDSKNSRRDYSERDSKSSRRDSNDRDSNFKKNNKNSDNKSGEVRLFIAKGKKDNIDKKSLFEWLEKESKVYIDASDVKIMESFSFITVPANQAEKILDKFEKISPKRPIIEVAK